MQYLALRLRLALGAGPGLLSFAQVIEQIAFDFEQPGIAPERVRMGIEQVLLPERLLDHLVDQAIAGLH
ncbi:hypothetical protein D9M73_273600 [compost metagenome]